MRDTALSPEEETAPLDEEFVIDEDAPVWVPGGADPDASKESSQRGNAPAGSGETPRRRGRFVLGLVVSILTLGLVSAGLANHSLTQGPRLSAVQLNPHEAVELSGSRVILIANQPLSAIDPQQVTVTPAVPFTVDAVGRSIGVRFTVPLDDNTEYTVTVEGVRGIGGGPSASLSTTFTTPVSELYVLQRTRADDTIFRTSLDGETAVAVFTHPRISAFRHAGDWLIVSVEEANADHLLVLNLEGERVRELELPGDGYVQDLQVSDRGGLVGYLYSDRVLTEFTGRASVLVTQSITAGAPTIVEVGARTPSVAEWQFVPDTASVLFIDFEGTLFVADRAASSAPSSLGIVLSLQGVERGTYTAVIVNNDGTIVRRDLADGTETAIPPSRPDFGMPTVITPFPGGMVQHIVARDDVGMPLGQLIVRVNDTGAATAMFEVGAADAILQACASPSGQYLAVTVAPNLVSNPYDDMMLAMPRRTETHVLSLRTGDPIAVLAGFNVSWCALGSRM